MPFRARRVSHVLLMALAVACSACGPRQAPSPRESPTATASASPTSTAVASPTPRPVPVDIRVTRLAIPSINIDSPVQGSQVVPSTSVPTPGCPARPVGEETFTVPNYGIVTPEGVVEGLAGKSWIFGHSRWQNQPGILYSLQDISVGDELFVDGVDRGTGQPVAHRRFVVDGIYLTDIDSGGEVVAKAGASTAAPKPVVILETSVREDGANKQWLLNQQKVLTRARNVIDGDVNDPCKYLLLFVVAQSS
ncbi:MAG: hypothetical protein WCQ48_06115 [Chloroflexota bacterium]